MTRTPESLMSFYEEGRKLDRLTTESVDFGAVGESGILIRVKNRRIWRPANLSDYDRSWRRDCRSSFEQCSRRRADQCRNAEKVEQSRRAEQQVRRMLADPRSKALVENFADQVLYLRNLPVTRPMESLSDWDDELRGLSH
jgi:hypothetical protein